MSHVMSYPCCWSKLLDSFLQLQQDQPPRRCQRPEAQNPGLRQAPGHHRAGLGGVGGVGGVAAALPSANGLLAATTVALLHSRQNSCTAGSGQRGQRGSGAHGMVQKTRICANQKLSLIDRINQTKDVLKIKHCSIDIVQ